MNANSPSQTAVSPQSLLLTMHERLASQSATCKLVGMVLAVAVLTAVSGRTSAYLFLPLVPLLSALLLDAAYAARAGQALKLMRGMAGGEAKATVSQWDMVAMHLAPQGLNAALPALGGVLLFSVWPFYLALGLIMTLLGGEVLAPKPLPVLPRIPVVSGDHVSAPPPGKYPASGAQAPGQFQGFKPPQNSRPGPPVVNGGTQPLPGGSKGSPVFSARPSLPVKPSQTVTPPPPNTPAAPAPASSLAKPAVIAAPTTGPKVSSQLSPAPSAPAPIIKPATTTGNDGAKQP